MRPGAGALDGIHHITAITGDAPRNVDFYVRVMGLRLVKKTVNHDMPEVYHLYYADEAGTPGSILTFFEFPGAAPGRAGAGMVHRITWRVGGEETLDFWAERLAADAIASERGEGRLGFSDPEGLGLELAVAEGGDRSAAEAPDIPAEHRLFSFDGVRALALDPAGSGALLGEVLGFSGDAGDYRIEGERRRASYDYDPAPVEAGFQGAGSVHHIAWACRPEDQGDFRARLAAAGAQVTPIIDRTYFRSIYFREPSGVLFEIATIGPGFAVDEPIEQLGESLALPERLEGLRAELERRLTPIRNPRTQPIRR